MDVREKLVELLLQEDDLCERGECKDCFANGSCYYYRVADRLIAHGVTVQEDCKECAEATQNCIVKLQEQIAELRSVQEWISVKDRLPEDMVDVLTCDEKGNIHIMWHHHEYQYPFNIGRNDIRYFPVTHWCYLPQPPKGE